MDVIGFLKKLKVAVEKVLKKETDLGKKGIEKCTKLGTKV